MDTQGVTDAPGVLWRVEMLGGLRARAGGRVVERFQTQRTGALLAYLACYPGRRHPRETLVDLLWPDAELGPGRNRLSQALGWLRSQCAPAGGAAEDVFLADRQSVGLNTGRVTSDVAEFEAAAAPTGDGPAQLPSLLRAVALYKGELLPGYYDDWVLAERVRLLGLFLAAQRRLGQLYERQGDWEAALSCARSALAADPLAEELHCDLIRLLAAGGQPAAARRQFRELERLLAEELDETPSPAARALLAQIGQSEPPAPASERALPPSLPVSLTRFFGRDAELTLAGALVRADGVRLVTLTGTGGAGKTRLAIEAASRLAGRFAGAVWFVPCADLRDAGLLPTALADALRLPHAGASPPLEQVAAALARRPSLLVLDNLEHLQDAAPLLRNLLEWVPTLTVLGTSRHRLGLEGEREVAVPPLPVPPESPPAGPDQADAEQLMRVDSVRLFVDRARAVRPAFAVTAGNAATVARLCRRLEGLPLALELCAAWAQTLTPAQMLAQLTRRFDLLVSRRTDIAPRHRSLRAAVEYSYLLLPADLQQFFVGLSVFRGGWTLEAAEAVCLATGHAPLGVLTALTELCERSLATADEGGAEAGASDESRMRYRMLEALREFAAEQRTLAVEVPLRLRHAEYFLRLAETASQRMAGPDQVEWLGRLEAEHDNLRAALAWALEAGALEAGAAETGLRLAGALVTFWDVRGFYSEGEEWLARLLALPEEGGRSRERLAVRARALDARGLLARGRAEFAAAEAAARQALPLWQELEDDRGVALSLQFLATLAYSREDYEAARGLLEDSLRLARGLGDPSLVARVLNSQGNIALEQRQWAQADAHFAESLSLHRARGDRKRVAAALNNLGLVARYQGDYPTALRRLREDLAICRDLSDRSSTAIALLNLGTVHRLEGRFGEARAALGEALTLLSEGDDRRALAWCIKEAGHLACAEADHATGICLLAASEGLRRSLGMSFQPADPGELRRDSVAADEVLGEERYAAVWEAGEGLSFAQALTAAIGSVAGLDRSIKRDRFPKKSRKSRKSPEFQSRKTPI